MDRVRGAPHLSLGVLFEELVCVSQPCLLSSASTGPGQFCGRTRRVSGAGPSRPLG